MAQDPLNRRPSFASRRFEVRRRIGRGSVGVVYLAYDRERQEDVALKTLLDVAPLALFRFKQEFRALADVAHPNLVRLHELICEDGRWYFTMAPIVGVDFCAYARAHPERLPAALIQLVRGIDALHAADRLHRDVKPTNVLVTAEHRVVLLDFGLVTPLDGFELGGQRRVCGTAGYMSPEQAGARRLTPASDLYSLGALLFEALTGALPFEGNVEDVLDAKRRYDGPAPHTRAPEVPPLLDRLTVDLLKRDPEERPSTAVVLRRLGATIDTPAPRPPPSSAPILQAREEVFIGRRTPLAKLAGAFEALVEERRAAAIAIRGESGIGKTALVRRFLDGLDAVVLAGRCYERESVPFKAIDPIVDALCHHLMLQPIAVQEALLPEDTDALASVFPVLRRCAAIDAKAGRPTDATEPQRRRTRAFVALQALLGNIARREPLVLYIEDAQWADADSTAALTFVLRGPHPPPILLLVCCRDEEAPSPFLEKTAGLDVESIELGPLAENDAKVLAVALLNDTDGGADDERVAAKAAVIATESAGHPLFVTELVRFAADEAIVGGPDLALDAVLARRIERLSPGAVRILEVVAIAGHPLDRLVALRAADAAEHDLVRLLHAHFLRAAGGRAVDHVVPTHDRIRDYVVASLPEYERRAHHRRLAAELGRTESAPDTIARHHLGGGRPDLAAADFVRGGRRLHRAFAFDRAAELFRAAIAVDDAPERIARTRRRLGKALANAGRGAEAASAYLAAAEGLGPADAVACRRKAAEQLLRSGHVDEGLALLEEVLGVVGASVPRHRPAAVASLIARRARLLFRGTAFDERASEDIPKEQLLGVDLLWAGALGLGMVDVVRSFDFLTAHLLGALELGEPYRVARALAGEALNSAAGGSRTRSKTRRLLFEADRIATRIDHPHSTSLVLLATGMSESLVGHWRRAVDSYDRAIDLLEERCCGVAWERDTAEHMRIWALAYLGELPAMRVRIDELCRDARDRRDRYALSLFTNGLGNLVWLADDDVDGATAALEDGMRPWSRRGFHLQHYDQLLARIHIDLYRGEPSRAHRRLEATWRDLSRSQLLRVQQIRIEAWHLAGRAALAASDSTGSSRARLLDEALRAARRIEREGVAWGEPLAELLRAGVRERRGDASAAAAYASAAHKLLAADMPLLAHAARLRLQCAPASEAFLRAVGVRDPDRFARILVP